ncbi:conserved hypothetical protein [Vibrio nigripulchritudo AM115]|nr:conserved hypothetical protein [Vibrio nigripulchritudo AM115]
MIIIATCNKYPNIGQGLALIVNALIAKGHNVKCVPWQHADLQLFCRAKAILPLCAWDYADNVDGFRHWITVVTEGGGNFINASATLLHNMNKHYLIDLAEQGFNVVPTRYLEKPTPKQLHCISESEGWPDMVLKPAYGQSGRLVTRYSSDISKDHEIFCSEHDIVVQPFVEAIKIQGELALCFIAGEFSHAVRRLPAKEDWRANSQYHVTVSQVELPQSILKQAVCYLSSLEQIPLYARVDGVILNDDFVLCELELIEPALFFDRIENLSNSKFKNFIEQLGQ